MACRVGAGRPFAKGEEERKETRCCLNTSVWGEDVGSKRSHLARGMGGEQSAKRNERNDLEGVSQGEEKIESNVIPLKISLSNYH